MRRFASLCAIAVTAACSPQQQTANSSIDINAAADAARNDIAAYAAANAAAPGDPSSGVAANPMPTPVAPPAPGMPGGLRDDGTPVSEAPFAPDSAQGAANVVQTYFALLEQRAYGRAWALWDRGGQASGIDRAAFAASFAKYADYHAQVGAPGRIDAGAGQRYVTVPVVVYGRLKSGGAVHMKGDVTLHRVADIDGATAAEKSWHISASDLKAGAADPDGARKAPADR